jgi:hypothetical protein
MKATDHDGARETFSPSPNFDSQTSARKTTIAEYRTSLSRDRVQP